MALRPELSSGAGGSSHPGEPAAARRVPAAELCPPPPAPSCAFRSLKTGWVHPAVQTRRHGPELRLLLRMKFSSSEPKELTLSKSLED